MLIRRNTALKYYVAAFLGAAIYCEWVIYLVQPQYWTDLDCSEHDSTCTKILFIADPQIQGDNAIAPPLSYIVNWDSDRYLKATFTSVIGYFKPDVLVFMGDVMDEGSISTQEQFHNYVKRLANIFEVDYQVLQVWIPGDNDIGGENEPIRHDKMVEFEKVFQQSSTIYYRNITFYKVNAITLTPPQKADTEHAHDTNLKIAVSHYPLTWSTYGMQVYNSIQPNIFFCAHDHSSKYVEQSKALSHRKVTRFNHPKSILSIDFNDDSLFEIYVPTCSYRMGTNRIGYGAAVLENNNQYMRYTVLWSPTRFPYLFLYAFIVVVVSLYYLIYYVARITYDLQTKKKRRIHSDTAALL